MSVENLASINDNKMKLYFDSLEKIFKNRNDEELKKIKVSNLFNIEFNQILYKKYMKQLAKYLSYKQNSSYKKEKDYHYYDLYSKLLLKDDNICNTTLYDYVIKLSTLKKSQYILNKIKFILIKKKIICKNTYSQFIKGVCEYGTLPAFLFWLKYTNNFDDYTETELDNIIIENFKYSCVNSDDRIYKYIINNNLISYIDKTKLQEGIKFILDAFNIPDKYKLRRVKFISERFEIKDMIYKAIDCINNIFVLERIINFYYYKSFDNEQLYNIGYTISYISDVDYTKYINIKIGKIFKKLKTQEEKDILLISILLQNYKLYEKLYENNYKIKNWKEEYLIKDKLIDILNCLYENSYTDDYNIINKKWFYKLFNINIKFTKNIIKQVCKEQIYGSWSNQDSDTNEIIPKKFLIFIAPFINFFTTNGLSQEIDNYFVKINLITHNIRLFCKRKIKGNLLIKKLKFYPVLQEILYFEPNEKYKVLSKGSRLYRIKNNDLSYIDNLITSKLYLSKIKKSYDTNYLPLGIEPCKHIENYIVKAKYIEDMDLYLIFDIDIPNTTKEERYKFLRLNHPSTKNMIKPYIINKKEELSLYSKVEDDILEEFLDIEYNFSRWFPLPYYKLNYE
jgi:hypothetical protein